MIRFIAAACILIASVAILATPSFAQTTAVINGKVHTVGPMGTLEKATIVMVDGKISAVGKNVRVPSGATVIDAAGKIVTPGLFAPRGDLGLREISGSGGPVDSRQRGEQFTASFDVADAYNRRSTLIAINRIEGLTHSAIVPSPGSSDDYGKHGHILSGLAAVVNLGDGDSIEKRGAAMAVTLGENGSGFSGDTRTGGWLMLKNALDEAIDYRDNKVDFERRMRREYQYSATDLEALQSVIAGTTPLLVNIHRASDIEVLIELVEDYDLKAIINGGAEAWMVADQLAAAQIPVILAVSANLPRSFDGINSRNGAATILHAAGVQVALSDAVDAAHNARNITQSAGNAVADGMDWEDALRAITLTPAEIYGVADTVGSLEVGKAADLVIWPADPLELTTYADQVFIKGVAIPMISRQTLLRDRYLQGDTTRPPAYRD